MTHELELGSFFNGTLAPGETLQFSVSSISYFVTAVLFQVHISRLDGSVGIGPESDSATQVVGIGNSGFITHLRGSQSTAVAFVKNRDKKNSVKYQIEARTLTKTDPVPGGCALEFPQPHVPIILVKYPHQTKSWLGNTLRLEWPGPDSPYSRSDHQDGHCEEKDLFTRKLEFHLVIDFLDKSSNDLNEDDIFRAVRTFSSPSDAYDTGSKVCKLAGGLGNRISVPSWPGRPFVASVIVENTTSSGSSSYIPVLIDAGTAEAQKGGVATKVILGAFALLGVLLAFLGHYYFRWGQAGIGFFGTSFVTFVFLDRFIATDDVSFDGKRSLSTFNTDSHFTKQQSMTNRAILEFRFEAALLGSEMELIAKIYFRAALGITVGAAVIGALLMVLFWDSIGSPFLASLAAAVLFGFILAATASFYLLDNWSVLHGKAYLHFLALACIILLTPAFLLFFKKLAHIIPCAGIGGFVVATSLSYFLSGSLHYIIIRSVQRFTLPWFHGNWCFITTFSTVDIILCSIWGAVLIFGSISQSYLTAGRSPFPAPASPHPFVQAYDKLSACCTRENSENEPLIIDPPDSPVIPSAPPASAYGTIS